MDKIDYNAIVTDVWRTVELNDPVSLNEWVFSFRSPANDDAKGLSEVLAEYTPAAKTILLKSIQTANKNLLLDLIKPSDDPKCLTRVRLAIQFLLAMAKRPECEQYIRATLNYERKVESDKSSRQTNGSKHICHNGILHEAARYGCCHMLEKYLDSTNVNIVNALDGTTALHIAAEFGHDRDVQILLKNGARILCDKDGCTPLHSASISSQSNARVARLLVATIIKRDRRLLHSASNDGGNTALHIAAGNPNISASFIATLKDMDPRIRNADDLTPLHIAATSQNNKAIVMMLKTFAPTPHGWDIDFVDGVEYSAVSKPLINSEPCSTANSDTENENKDTLISICARNGNTRAVRLLIDHGADISLGVLRDIAFESVRCPEKTKKLLEVYRTITDGAVTWRCLEETKKCPIKGSGQYKTLLKETMIFLNTAIDKSYRPTDQLHDERNFIEWCIDNGAEAFLSEIFNTNDVFKFDSDLGAKYMTYDVTDIMDTIKQDPKVSKSDNNYSDRQFGKRRRAKESYLNRIVCYEEEWQNATILKTEPFRKLTKPFFGFVQRLYFVLGLIHLVFMSFFTAYFISPESNLRECNNLNESSAAEDNSSAIYFNRTINEPTTMNPLSWLWLVWPGLVFVYTVCRYCWMCLRTCGTSTFETLVDWFGKTKPIHDREKLFTRLLRLTTLKLPVIAFSIGIFAWYHLIRTSCPRVGTDVYQQYLEVTAVTLLFGWMVAFIFFSGVSRSVYVFSLVLREIIVKDILSGFSLIFVFSVIAFSSAIYVLRQSFVDSPEPFENFNEVFAAALSIGDFFSKIDSSEKVVPGGRINLLRAVFIIFVTFMVIVLLNVLIAMVSNRYEEAKIRAENIWRFETVQLAMMIHNKECLRRLLHIDRCFFCCLCCCLCCDECGNKISSSNDEPAFKLTMRRKHNE